MVGKTYKRIVRGREVECRYSPRDSRAQHVTDVARLAAQGYRYRQIAETLDIAYEAVRVIVYTYDIPYLHKAGRPKGSE